MKQNQLENNANHIAEYRYRDTLFAVIHIRGHVLKTEVTRSSSNRGHVMQRSCVDGAGLQRRNGLEERLLHLLEALGPHLARQRHARGQHVRQPRLRCQQLHTHTDREGV